ncbi:MAG: 3-phosphoshikimate 1-carboxyvinyltransferase [candidate division Zixibacteria bacterium]|nr:3-phosphoshikimate 1-carboxyvinyltransferase [candidate division Zixibacteria bacterium]
MKKTIKPSRKIGGTISLPGDKSIAHRAALLSILSSGPIVAHNYPAGDDCLTSIAVAREFGVAIEHAGTSVTFTPPEKRTLKGNAAIYCGNSGTSARLLAGIIAGSGLSATITGDDSLSRRPMKRVAEPLIRMGAEITDTDGHLPLRIHGHRLLPFEYRMPVASAQVKSALLLAGVASGCSVRILEDSVTRDHTEIMLGAAGEGISVRDIKPVPTPDPHDPRKTRMVMPETFKREITLASRARIVGGEIDIPGDISTAAFFFAAAAISGGTVTVTNCGLNPTRLGILEHLKAINCKVTIENKTIVSGEARGSVTVTGGPLKARKISGDRTVDLIDEIPVVAVMAALAEGTTLIRDASELRAKESDRIAAIAENLNRMGVKCGLLEDGLAIEGAKELAGADLAAFGDHRIAMAFAVAALAAVGPSTLDTPEIVSVSCPNFFDLLGQVSA